MTAAAPASAKERNTSQQLNAQQLRAVDLVAAGMTDAEVADELGVDRATVWRWRTRNPWFEAALNRRREEVWGAARDRLRALVPLALDAVEQEITSGGLTGARTALELRCRLLRTGEHSRGVSRRLDKLGVTGSSPVAPITERPWKRGLSLCSQPGVNQSQARRAERLCPFVPIRSPCSTAPAPSQ